MENTDCLIPLTQGKFAVVSPEDYEFLSQFKWCAAKQRVSYGYYWNVMRTTYHPKKTTIRMHRVIAARAGLPESRRYDHRDRNGFNNTRENIRPCNGTQNQANRTKGIGKSSKFKGVCWNKASRKWIAGIGFKGKIIYLGIFQEEVDAHNAYVAAANRYFGEFACP